MFIGNFIIWLFAGYVAYVFGRKVFGINVDNRNLMVVGGFISFQIVIGLVIFYFGMRIFGIKFKRSVS